MKVSSSGDLRTVQSNRETVVFSPSTKSGNVEYSATPFAVIIHIIENVIGLVRQCYHKIRDNAEAAVVQALRAVTYVGSQDQPVV